jgi:hypothetical protein
VRSDTPDTMEAKMRPNTKTFLIVLAIGLIFGFGGAKEKLVNSTWCAVPLKLDGAGTEWQDVVMTLEEKVQVDYAFMNDADYLYVLFVFKDPEFLSSISQTGMTIYYDIEGKKKKDYGINFIQNQITAQQYLAMLEKQQGPLPEADRNRILANPNYAHFDTKVINTKAKDNASDVPAEAKPALYRMQKEQEGTIGFEFAIPLTREADLAPGIGTEAGKQIKVGFEWGGMTEAMKQARMERFRSRSERSAETVSDQPAGGTTASTARGRRSPKKYDFWVDVQLASKQ